MSPVNIVQTAVARGLHIIGITDHNSTRQCKLVWKLGRQAGLTVIPGCEVTTQEEVHCLSLFPDFDALAEFQRFLDRRLTYILNDPEIFGYQVLVDEDDNVEEEFDNYLGAAVDASIEEVEQKTHELSGIFIPAHVDRPRNSLFSQLGFIPPELKIDALQISKLAEEKSIRDKYKISPEISIVKFSDSHFLEGFGKIFTNFELEEPTFAEIRMALKNENDRKVWIP
jgi:PHP family Zn ribbon phosphoesterase